MCPAHGLQSLLQARKAACVTCLPLFQQDIQQTTQTCSLPDMTHAETSCKTETRK